MNIIIIEDELPAYRRLAKMILEVRPSAVITAHMDSIAAVTGWMAGNAPPHLVFCDIHLADGSAFDLLRTTEIPAPIIFTTAYDQYALDAFKTNSIAYLLKPVKKEELEAAIDKIERLDTIFNKHRPDLSTAEAIDEQPYRTRFMVRFGEHIKALMAADIAYCYSEHKCTYARTADGRTYPMDFNLDALEQYLDPKSFFRLNRQYLVHINAIGEMKTHTKARVIVQLNPAVKEMPVVSSERAPDFKQWLADKH
jgi:DNA-binding LytR/AlgR family response regulator